MIEFTEGQTLRAPYPFVRSDYVAYATENGVALSNQSWKPGTNLSADSEDYVADALGEIILTVVSIHKPDRFPTRVFYTRRWRAPGGTEFGRNKLRCDTVGKFRKLAKGYARKFFIPPNEDAEYYRHITNVA